VAAEQLTITGLTGVDVTLRVAGPGTRSYAFIIDWIFRLLLALAWIVVGTLVRRILLLRLEDRLVSGVFVIAFVLPALLIYFLYHPVLELVMRGRTPGKRIAGARIVTRAGATPSAGAFLVRNLFRLIDSLPFFYIVGLVCCLMTAQRVRIGDLAAGTVLVLDTSGSMKSLARLTALQESPLRPDAAMLLEELLERWEALEEDQRAALARALLAKTDAGIPQAQLARLDQDALRSRLRSLLATGRG